MSGTFGKKRMPELPEVEIIVQGLREPLVGRQFTGVHVGWDNLVARPSVAEFERGLVGQRILGLKRRGKYLIFALIGLHLYLVVRLGVTSPPWSKEAAGADYTEQEEPPPARAGLVAPTTRGRPTP